MPREFKELFDRRQPVTAMAVAITINTSRSFKEYQELIMQLRESTCLFMVDAGPYLEGVAKGVELLERVCNFIRCNTPEVPFIMMGTFGERPNDTSAEVRYVFHTCQADGVTVTSVKDVKPFLIYARHHDKMLFMPFDASVMSELEKLPAEHVGLLIDGANPLLRNIREVVPDHLIAVTQSRSDQDTPSLATYAQSNAGRNFVVVKQGRHYWPGNEYEPPEVTMNEIERGRVCIP